MEALELRFFNGCSPIGIAPVSVRASRVLLPNKEDIMLPLRMGNLDAIIRTIETNSAIIMDESLAYDSVELMVMEMMAAASQFLTDLAIEPDPLLVAHRPVRLVQPRLRLPDP